MYSFNTKRSPIDNRDIILESVYTEPIKLPSKFNLWKKLPGVRDQGSQGSCSAIVASSMKTWQEKADVNFKGYMSAQFVYNNRFNQDAEGMSPRDTFKILQKIGIVPETEYRYGKIESPDEIKPELIEMASKYRISGYAQINTLEGLKMALYKNGPCYIAFPIYDENRWDFWKPAFKGEKQKGGHALTITGWNKHGFIIQNSWGSDWNGHGYTMFPYEQWGMQWEIWTTLDANSGEPTKKRDVRQVARFFKKIFGK